MSKLLYIYKIKLVFDETINEIELKKLGTEIDEIFALKDIKLSEQTISSRVYYDNDIKSDYGYTDIWKALDILKRTPTILKRTPTILKHIKTAQFYNVLKREKIDLLLFLR